MLLAILVPVVTVAQQTEKPDFLYSLYPFDADFQLASDPPKYKIPGKALSSSLLYTFVPMAVGTTLMVAAWHGVFDFEYYDEEDQLQEAAGEFLLLGAGLTAYGLVVGPSAGLKYAGDFKLAKTGIYIRGASFGALIIAGFFPSPELRYPIQLAAMGGYGLSAIYSIVSGPKKVRKYNAGLDKKRSVGIGIAPAINGRSFAPTLTLNVQF